MFVKAANRCEKLIITIFFLLSIISCSDGNDSLQTSLKNTMTDAPRPFYNEMDHLKGIDIIISYGQSNAAGFGIIDHDSIVSSHSSSLKVKKCIVKGNVDYNGSCIEFDKISSPSDIYLKGKYSSWISFDQKLDSLERRKFVLINAAGDGQTLKSLLPYGEISGPENGIHEYENLISSAKEVMNIYGYKSINSLSVIWLQGEIDANIMSKHNLSNEEVSSTFKKYFNDLELLRSEIINDLNIPKLYFFVNRVGLVEEPMFSFRFKEILNDLGYWQIEFCKNNDSFIPLSISPRTFNIEDKTLSSDGIHYTSLGYNKLGNESAINWNLFMKNSGVESIIFNNNSLYNPTIVMNDPYIIK